jgi:hypothetical protein
MALPEILIGSKLDAKGFKQAETALNKLTKTVRNFAATFGVAFGATALVNYSKQAVKAFAADENAARSLGMTLKNLNLDYFGASSAVNMYISNLEKQTGVLDDELRPAMDRLLRATGSITESQKLLNLALDISAGTGKDLTTVSQGLQKAYLGNNASLGRLGVGLSKAELTSSSFLTIQERLTELFAGQATSAADGYQGSLNKLTIASNNAKEIIGKDLVDAMRLLSGDTGIGQATSAIEGFATQVGNAITGVSILIAKLKSIPGAGVLGDFLSAFASVSGIGAITQLGASSKARSAGTPAQSPGQRKAIDKANADAIKLQKTKNNLSTIDNNNTARKLVLTGDQLALQELEKKFDVERIGLFSAMNQATDGETKMRLLSLIAIKDQNTALAGQIVKANGATDALEAFRQALLASIKALLEKTQTMLASLQAQLGITAPSSDALIYPFNAGSARLGESAGNAAAGLPASGLNSMGFGDSHLSALANQSVNNITINATGIGDQQIAAVVQNAIQNLNRYGSSTTYAGAI